MKDNTYGIIEEVNLRLSKNWILGGLLTSINSVAIFTG